MPPQQSYAARQPSGKEGEKPVTVLVTGFSVSKYASGTPDTAHYYHEPFLEKFPKNSSWEIASTLPSLVPASPSNKTPIHIHVHHEPIRVSYSTVVDLVPKLLPPANPLYPIPDIILHIGLAAGRSYFALETGSHAHGYTKISDVDGQRFEDSLFERHFPTSQFPNRLNTSFDTTDVLARWKVNLGYTSINGTHTDEGCSDVRISEDAGNFLCGFIYYNSLAHYYSIKKDERPVVFLHVPDLSGSEDKLREGWEVTVGLIKALVESRRKVGWKVGDGERGDVEDQGGERTDNNFV